MSVLSRADTSEWQIRQLRVRTNVRFLETQMTAFVMSSLCLCAYLMYRDVLTMKGAFLKGTIARLHVELVI